MIYETNQLLSCYDIYLLACDLALKQLYKLR